MRAEARIQILRPELVLDVVEAKNSLAWSLMIAGEWRRRSLQLHPVADRVRPATRSTATSGASHPIVAASVCADCVLLISHRIVDVLNGKWDHGVLLRNSPKFIGNVCCEDDS